MKEEQLEEVVAFLSESDIFAVLPTGFGKSLCYACFLGEAEEKPIVDGSYSIDCHHVL